MEIFKKILNAVLRTILFLAGALFVLDGLFLYFAVPRGDFWLLELGAVAAGSVLVYGALRWSLTAALLLIGLALILVLLAFSSLNTHVGGHRNARRISDLKQLQVALEEYYDINREYPHAHSICDESRSFGLEALLKNEFMRVIPRDPSLRPGCYLYATPATSTVTTYHLGAKLDSLKHHSFNSDRDCNSSVPNGCVEGMGPYINGFDGTNDNQNRLFDLAP